MVVTVPGGRAGLQPTRERHRAGKPQAAASQPDYSLVMAHSWPLGCAGAGHCPGVGAGGAGGTELPPLDRVSCCRGLCLGPVFASHCVQSAVVNIFIRQRPVLVLVLAGAVTAAPRLCQLGPSQPIFIATLHAPAPWSWYTQLQPPLELQTMVREDITITEKAPTRSY